MLKVNGRFKRTGLCLVTLLVCLSSFSGIQAPAYAQGGIDWVCHTVDYQFWVGQYTSLAFGTGPAISYFDTTNENLKLAYDRNNDGDFNDIGEIIVVDEGDYNVGKYTSLAFGSGPAISYYDAQKGDLKFAYDRNDDGDFDDPGEIIVVDNGENDVGRYTSLAFGSGPAISYYDATNGSLKLAYDRNNDGDFDDTGEIITVDDSARRVGWYTSLAFGTGPAISYYDATNGDLKFAYDRNNDGDFDDTDEIITVDNFSLVGEYTSLAFGSGPAISYYDVTNGNLKLAYDRNNDGDFDDTGEIITVDNSARRVGWDTSLAFGTGPAISYYDRSNYNLKFAYDWNNDGDFNDTGEIITVDSAGQVGGYTSLAFDKAPAISYCDTGNGDLKFVRYASSQTWRFFTAGFFPEHLHDSYQGQIVLADLNPSTIPPEVQGVWWYDGPAQVYRFWVPGVGGDLTTLTGQFYNYQVLVTGPCEWEIPLP